MRAIRTVTLLGICISLFAAMMTYTAQPAAAAGCYRGSCTGQSPDRAGCAGDARTVTADNQLVSSPPFSGYRLVAPTLQSGVADAADVEMRYSKACRATWARLYSRGGHNFHGYLSVWIAGQPSQTTFIAADGSGSWFTPMVDGGAQNCIGMQIYQQGVYRGWRMGYCV